MLNLIRSIQILLNPFVDFSNHFFLPLRFIEVVFLVGGVLPAERLYEPGASAGDLLPVAGIAPAIPPSCIAVAPAAGL